MYERGEYMREQLQYQIPLKGKTVWRIYGLFTTLIWLAIGIGVSILTYFLEWPKYIYYIVGLIVVIIALLYIWLFPNIRWKIWRYEVREQEIEIQSGLFVVTRTLIPMVRVQHVDTAQGPILKKYNLANISISTAATVHTIPFLESEEADVLRARISILARVAEDDV